MRASDLGKLLEQNKLCIPEEKCLPDSNIKVPHVFIADETYPLRQNLMKPYSKKALGDAEEVYNKRLLSGYIETLPETADDIIKATCVLHSIIINQDGFCGVYESEHLPFPTERHLQPLGRSGNATSNRAKEVRNSFKNYFVNNP